MPPLLAACAPCAALEGRGMSHEQARVVINRLVEAQSATVGVVHVFFYAFAVFMIAAAIVWLAPKSKGSASVMSAH